MESRKVPDGSTSESLVNHLKGRGANHPITTCSIRGSHSSPEVALKYLSRVLPDKTILNVRTIVAGFCPFRYHARARVYIV